MKFFSALFLLLAAVMQPLFADDIVSLRFCYEDKQLLPYYAGNGEQIASPPGVTIEHLQASVADIKQLQLQLQRKPWLRCLQLLEQNKIDALVATYAESRQHYAVYPLDGSGKPNPALAFSQQANCLVQRPGDDVLKRAGNGVVVARPLGYSTPSYPVGVTVLPVRSQQQAFELVQQGRVDATTTLCEVDSVKLPASFTEGLELVQPPLYRTTGYLVFSKAFFQQHDNLASQLWQALQQHRDPQRYYHYLQQEDTETAAADTQH